MSNYGYYCPVCGRIIEPVNADDYDDIEHDGLVYIHDHVPHQESDMDALNRRIQ